MGLLNLVEELLVSISSLTFPDWAGRVRSCGWAASGLIRSRLCLNANAMLQTLRISQ